MFLLMYDGSFGVISHALYDIGILSKDSPLLASHSTALYAVILVDVWQWTPFVALVLLAGLTMVPNEVEEAARLETKNRLTVLRYVQLPFLLPGLVAVLILRTADTLKLFDMVFTLTRGGPGFSTELPSTFMYEFTFSRNEMAVGASSAVMMLALVTILIVPYLYSELRNVDR